MAEESIAKHIREAIEEVTDFDAQELTEIGQAALTVITLRTKSGRDADRKPFIQYSESYKEVRAAHSLSFTKVDLARTGHMIGSMLPVPDMGRGEVVIRFMSANEERKANYHVSKATRKKIPLRDFFDVRAPEDVDFVLDACGRQLENRIEKVRK